MENNTNFKGNTALMTVILVFLALALLTTSSVAAQPITVDGNGSDWDPSWFLASDPLPDTGPGTGDIVYCGDAGYNLTGGWQHYNATEDKLYFMLNLTGIAGDVDGNGNPNNGSGDEYGVGLLEYYAVMINTSPMGDPRNSYDVMLYFFSNSAFAIGPKAHLVTPVAAINTTEGFFTSFVEFSVDNVTDWMTNPYKYSLCCWASAHLDGHAEDWLGDVLCVTFPPVANFTFVAGDCNQTVWFDPSGSYDDPYGGIVNYTWNFSDGTPVEVRLNNSSFSHTFPVTNGTYNVSLTVIDTDNLTNTFVDMVPVNREPSINSVTANKTSVVEPGEWVLFEGWYSDPDGDTLTYRWVVDGVEIANGSFTNYSNASYFVNRTLIASLTVTDECGCTATDNMTVTYLWKPVPVIDFAATGCLRVELNASGSYDPDGNITDYLWDAENGSIDDNTNVTCTANFSVGGNHTIRLNVTDNDGLTNSTTREIYVSCVPTAAARANRTTVTVPGGMVLFDAPNSTCDTVGDANNSLNYIWTIHGTPYPDSSGEGIEYFVTNTTTAFLTVMDVYNCTAADNVTVTCQHPPVAEFDFNGTGCKVGVLNASASSDPDGYIEVYDWDLDNDSIYGEPDDDATGVTCTFGPVPAGDYWIGLKVTDNASVSNTTRKQITVTGDPNAVAEANGHTGSLQLPEGGGWVVFDGTNSTAYPGTEIVNASCTWDIPGNGTYFGLGPILPIFIDRDTTATLTVVANNTCTDVSRVRVLMPPTEEDVPILTPAGMIALIGILCIAGRGRITKKGRRS